MALTIDSRTCLACGRCALVCRRFILEKDNSGIQIHHDREVYCMHCGHCAAACPVGALTLDGSSSKDMADACLPEHADRMLLNILQSRRSCGAFSSRPVPRETILAAISDTRYAPTARNQNSISWLVVDSRETLDALRNEVLPFYRNSSDPVSRSHYENHLHGRDSILRGAPCLVLATFDQKDAWGMTDCATAATELQLILHVRGMASCWAGGLLRRPSPACLHIPEEYAIGAALMIGYPKTDIKKVPLRPERNVSFL